MSSRDGMPARSGVTAEPVLSLADCAASTGADVGGKANGLGAMLQAGLPVPDGFAITTGGYRRAVAAAGIGPQIRAVVESAAGDDDKRDAAGRIASMFDVSMLPDELANVIADFYAGLADEQGDAWVAVRSSATAEDTADASFAGQQETYLWVRGLDSLKRHVVRCWASLFTPQAIAYRQRFESDSVDLAMGVVVQRMVPARCAGVMMTLEPVTGDRSQIYIEAAYGLGEGVVRGDVGCDRYWVDKAAGTPRAEEINTKGAAHALDPEAGEVRLVEITAADQDRPALSPSELAAAGGLANSIEAHFGVPMDIEWAIPEGGGGDEILLLQARPETVWSRDPDGAPEAEEVRGQPPTGAVAGDEWDTLQCRSAPALHWSTDNLGEAAPGVLSTLGWSLWGGVGEGAARDALYQMGALRRSERDSPSSPEDRILRVFFGRIAMQVELLATVGNRTPGTSGRQVVEGIFGRAPDDIDYTPSRRQYPAFAARLPRVTATTPRRVRALAQRTDAWWREATAGIGTADLATALAALRGAREQFRRTLTLHTLCLMGVVQPMFDALSKLVDTAGVGDVALLSGTGGAEMAVVSDIWRASRGDLGPDGVVANHGFHGPAEGELSSRVWREDPSPIRRLIAEYTDRPESEDPRQQEARRHQAAGQARRELLAALPPSRRPGARLLLRMAATRMPLRGVGKRSFLQSLDVARAAARRVGEHLVAESRLDEPDDVFSLTYEEITGDLPAHARQLVALRQQRRRDYQELAVPAYWQGDPRPLEHPAGDGPVDSVSGVGVSAGVVEGTARVVASPDFAEVKPDEILVAPTTDPSWSSIMFVSAALVVDIGGALSHAAVVARELGLPCVVNTRTGTQALRTGDRVRVDGRSGMVKILDRAAESTVESTNNTIVDRSV